MGFSAFYSPGRTGLENVLKILCLICWAIGGIIYCLNIYLGIESIIIFPLGTSAIIGAWIMHLAMRFFCLFLPLGFLLIHWRMKRTGWFIGYLIGCFITAVLSIVALIVVLKYQEPSELRKEYFKNIEEELKDQFPTSIKYTMTSDTYKCCSWYGPTDFGEVYDLTDRKDSDLEFMQNVAKCYGGIFEVKEAANGAGLEYSSVSGKTRNDVPKACSKMFKEKAYLICNYIFYMTIILVIQTIMVAILYIMCYLALPSANQVSPKPAQQDDRPNPVSADASQISANMASSTSVSTDS